MILLRLVCGRLVLSKGFLTAAIPNPECPSIPGATNGNLRVVRAKGEGFRQACFAEGCRFQGLGFRLWGARDGVFVRLSQLAACNLDFHKQRTQKQDNMLRPNPLKPTSCQAVQGPRFGGCMSTHTKRVGCNDGVEKFGPQRGSHSNNGPTTLLEWRTDRDCMAVCMIQLLHI